MQAGTETDGAPVREYSPNELRLLQETYHDGFRRLRFPDPWEAYFREDYNANSVMQTRIAAMLGILLYTTFGIRDLFLASEVIGTVWIIRFGVVMPILVLVLLLSYIPVLQQRILFLSFSALIAVGLGVLTVSSVMDRPANYLIDMGLIPIIVYACTVARLRFFQALWCVSVLFVMYQGFAFANGTSAPFFMGSEPYMVHQAFSFLILITALISLFANYMLEYRTRENFVQNRLLEADRNNLQGMTRVLQQLSSTDALTGLYNRRHFAKVLENEWRRLQREGRPLSILLLDVDFFKPYNDNYGHQAGDDVLRKMGSCLKGVAKRASDIVARYGGEEFIMLLPECDLTQAQKFAAHTNQAVRDQGIEHEFSKVAPVLTCSIGVVCVVPHGETTPKAIIERADECLYAAKEAGRNRYIAAQA